MISNLFYSAAKWSVAVFAHVRDAGSSVPGIFESLQEVLADSVVSDAPLHVMRRHEALRTIECTRSSWLGRHH